MTDPSVARGHLVDRRQRLETALSTSPENQHLIHLLTEVDSALERIERGTYGLCQACRDPIEPERLTANPLLCFCLDHLTMAEQRALEQDLELASRIQTHLLPQPDCRLAGWEAFYHYQPAGPVSGDYCDILSGEDSGELLFLVGDVSGKGVAASMLMAHLHAMFRSLAGYGLPLNQLLERANRLFCDSTLATHFATLVAVRASSAGEAEICSAGHCPVLLLRGPQVTALDPTGLPLGLFQEGKFPTQNVSLSRGDGLLLYTDGLPEARNPAQTEFGLQRLYAVLGEHHASSPRVVIEACLERLHHYRSGVPLKDDLTAMMIRRV